MLGSNRPVVTAATVALVVCLSQTACKKDGAGNAADAGPAVSAGGTAKPTPKEVPFAAKLAASTPLDPKVAPQEGGGLKVTAERCQMEGGPLTDKSNLDVTRALRVIGDKAYLVDADESIRAYDIAPGAACKLTIDKTFGAAGIMKLTDKISYLASDTVGHLYASGGIFGTSRLTGGKVDYKCEARPQGYVYVHPNGKLGIGTFANATVAKLSFDDKGCKSEPWVFQDLSDTAKRKGPLGNAQAVGFVGDTILVGGVLAKEVDPNEPRVVLALDAAGKEKFRFGAVDKGGSSEDRFGWVHGIAPCKPGICVLDSNYRRITFWKTDGKYVGFVKLDKLFGLEYPWISSFAAGKNGATYFATGQERQKSGASEANIYRVSGL